MTIPIQTEIFVDTDILDEWSSILSRWGSLAKGTAQSVTRFVRKGATAELTREPGSPVYPYVWSLNPAANARARRWYFANKVPKGSRGGRYRRTGAMLKAWKIKVAVRNDRALITMENPSLGAEYVQGRFQIFGHIRTGWPNADEIALKWSEIATDKFIDAWFTITDPFAGITP